MPKIGGKNISWWWIIGGGAGAAAVVYLYRRSASSSAASSSTGSASAATVTDPSTGQTYPADGIDSATGMTYASEIAQYGSVAAADSAITGSSSAEGYGYYSGVDSGYPTEPYGSGATTSTAGYATNAQWAQAVTSGLTGLGYSAQDVAAALGLYFAGHPLGTLSDGASALSIVQAAVAEYGPPPVGSYQIIGEPTGSGGTSSKTKVPSVVGDTEADARTTLRDAKFAVLVSGNRGSDSVVTEQNPKAGQEARTGSTVTFTLAKKK